MPRRNPYDVLDLSPLATFDEARAAYRRLATIFHPDRFVTARDDVRAEAEKQMRYVNEAWSSLNDKLRSSDRDDDFERTRRAEPFGAPLDTDKASWAAEDDFSSRARHARTKQRTWARSNSAAGARAQGAATPDQADRSAFVQEAAQRLAEEEARRSGTS